MNFWDARLTFLATRLTQAPRVGHDVITNKTLIFQTRAITVPGLEKDYH